MAAELQMVMTTGLTGYFQVRSTVGTIWNGSSLVAYNTANIATYAVTATEQGTASGYYTGTMPALAAGVYNVIGKQRVGGSVAESDPTVASGQIEWNGTTVAYLADKAGYSLAATGLDIITATDPTGVASTWPQKMVQIWQSIFKRHKKDATGLTIKVYQDDGTSVATTQTYTVAGDGSQDIAAAS